MIQIGPAASEPHSTVVTEQHHWSTPATDRPDWGPGARHTYVAERTVRTEYGPWRLVAIDGRPLPDDQSPYDGLFYKGDGSPGTERREEPADD